MTELAMACEQMEKLARQIKSLHPVKAPLNKIQCAEKSARFVKTLACNEMYTPGTRAKFGEWVYTMMVEAAEGVE